MKLKLDLTTIALAALFLYLYQERQKAAAARAAAATLPAENRVKTPVSFLEPVQPIVSAFPQFQNGAFAEVSGPRRIISRVL